MAMIALGLQHLNGTTENVPVSLDSLDSLGGEYQHALRSP
jgi:hypothetical protein